jgi:ABC-type transporter Mla subunit MlaD
MAFTKEQIDIFKRIEAKGNEWLANFYQHQLATESEMTDQVGSVITIVAKARTAIIKADQENIGTEDQGSIPMTEEIENSRKAKRADKKEKKKAKKDINKEAKQLKKDAQKAGVDPQKLEETLERWKDVAVDWVDSGFDKILGAKAQLDKGLIGTAEDLISKAEGFLALADLLGGDGELGEKIQQAQGWIDGAKKVIDKVNALEEHLKKWRDVAVGWMESGIDGIVAGGQIVGDISAKAVAEANDVKKLLKDFIDKAKEIGDAGLDEKVEKAQAWMDSANNLIDKAGDMLDQLFKDGDANNLPDWYDVLSREWEKLAAKDLIPGDIDNKIIEKLNEFKGKVDDFVEKATAEYSPAIKEKIDQAKMWVNNIKTLLDLTAQGQQFVDALRDKDFNKVYDQLKGLWDGLDGANSILDGTDIDDKLLDKLREYKDKANNFAKLANSLVKKFPGGDKVGEVEDWIKGAMDIATRMANGEDVVGNYLELAKQWAEGKIKQVVDGAEEVTEEVAGQVSGFVNEVKKFIAGASALKGGDFDDKIAAAADWIKSSESILDKASELIGLAVGDADGNNLPDWYDKLAAAWDNISGKDLIPGMDFDDALIGKVNLFKGQVEKWLEKAVDVGGDLQEKINTARQWIDKTSGFLKEAAGFVEDIKEGDLLSIYEKIKKGWAAIGNTDDLLEGTRVDNKILDAAKKVKEDAEAFVANALTGGKANGEMTDEVKDILSMADNFLTFLFTKYEVQDSSHEFQEDKIKVEFPGARELSEEQAEAILGELSGGFEGPLKNKLGAILTRVNQEIIILGTQIDGAYRKTMESGGGAAKVYIKAKEDYESVMKKQKDVEKLLESVRKVLVGAVTAALIPVNPAAAAAVGTLLSGTLDGFGDLAGLLANTASQQDGTVGQIGGFLSTILPSGSGQQDMAQAEQAGLINLQKMYQQGVTAKYEEIKELVAKIQVELDKIYANLYKQNEEGLENAKDAIAVSGDQWKRLKGEIMKKYVNAKTARINEQLAYKLLTRAQYATWLWKKDDVMIVKVVIETIKKKGYLQEAGVKEWDTNGVGGKIARGLGWLLGKWASFGYGDKLEKLNAWGKKEVTRLSKPGVWKAALQG